jgi:hypothetical protein
MLGVDPHSGFFWFVSSTSSRPFSFWLLVAAQIFLALAVLFRG